MGRTVVGGNAVAIIDPGSNRVSGQVPVGVAPAALAVGAGGLWVANTDASDPSVTHIDLASGRLVGNVSLAGDVPLGVAATSNAVWMVGRQPDGSPVLVKIDPHFDTAGPARTLPGSASGGMGVAVGRGDVWVVSEGGQLDRFDSAGKQVGAPIDTGASPSSVAVGAGGIWAADKYGNTVSRIDADTKLSTATPVGNDPTAVAVGAGAVWAADEFDDKVVRIDPATDSVTTSITVGQAPAGIAVGLGSVWVANSVDGTVSRIDPRTNTVVKTIPVGGSPQAIAVGGGKVWVSVQNALVDPGKQAGLVAHVTELVQPSLRSIPQSPFRVAWEIEYATCAKLFNYPDRRALAGTRLEPEVADSDPRPHRRRQDLHLHDQARLPLLPAVERPCHRRDVQVLDRAKPQQDDVRTPHLLPWRRRRRPGLHGREGEAHLRSERARQHAHDPAHAPRPADPDEARVPALLRRPDRHPDRRAGREDRARRRTVLRRLLPPGAGRSC